MMVEFLVQLQLTGPVFTYLTWAFVIRHPHRLWHLQTQHATCRFTLTNPPDP
jgi:hypothetical protein